jgi:hypothetical protein
MPVTPTNVLELLVLFTNMTYYDCHPMLLMLYFIVSMIIQIGKDIRYFLLVQLLMICGFAQAFWILSYEHSFIFSTPSDSFLRTFIYMLGQGFDADLVKFEDSAVPIVNTVLFCAFLLFLYILMLNLLISLMSDSYNKVRMKGLGTWRMEQTSIILAQAFKLGEKNVYNCDNIFIYVHVLQYASDYIENDPVDIHEGITKHVDFIKDNMKQYGLLDIAHNIKALDEKSAANSLLIEERIAANKIDLEHKVSDLLYKSVDIEEKLDLVLTLLGAKK